MTDELLRRYTYKLRPKPAQSDALHYQRRMMGQLYNALLAQRIEQWRRESQRSGRVFRPMMADEIEALKERSQRQLDQTRKAKIDAKVLAAERGEPQWFDGRRGLTYYDQCKEITALRRECPEWAALSSSSMAATAQRLDRAYLAFMSRASEGAGASSGFPRFKRSEDYPSIPFKRHRDCWRFDDNRWLIVRGVPGRIRARGKLPIAPTEIKTCDILWRAGTWWLSLVVEMPPRRAAGTGSATLRLDLVTKFASLETGDGARRPGPDAADSSAPDGRISPQCERVKQSSVAAAPELGADDGAGHGTRQQRSVAAAPELGADDGRRPRAVRFCDVAAAPELGAGDGRQDSGLRRYTTETLQRKLSACVKGSNRWTRLKLRLAKLHASEARQRRENAHEYTTNLQRRFRDIAVAAPKSITTETKSAAGTKPNPGAEVRFKAMLNRRILDFMPSQVMLQLDYKFAEAGGSYARIDDDRPATRIGAAVVETAKSIRKTRKQLRRKQANVGHRNEHEQAQSGL